MENINQIMEFVNKQSDHITDNSFRNDNVWIEIYTSYIKITINCEEKKEQSLILDIDLANDCFCVEDWADYYPRLNKFIYSVEDLKTTINELYNQN